MPFAESLLALASFVFAHAVWNISDLPKGDLLVPFAIVEKSGQRHLLRFEAESQEKAISEGKAALSRREQELDSWAFAREGQVKEGNAYVDVLTVEAKARGEPSSVMFVQRFQPFASGKFKLLGRPAVIVGGKALSEAEAKPYLTRLYKGIESHVKAAERWQDWSGR